LELVLDEKRGALLYLMNKKDQKPLVEQASVYFLLNEALRADQRELLPSENPCMI
jgi:hypothetical protein